MVLDIGMRAMRNHQDRVSIGAVLMASAVTLVMTGIKELLG
jgi:hypothetical protein